MRGVWVGGRTGWLQEGWLGQGREVLWGEVSAGLPLLARVAWAVWYLRLRLPWHHHLTPHAHMLFCCTAPAAAAVAAAEEKEARQAKLAEAAWQAVCAEYDLMRAAIRDPAARGTAFTQPWLDFPPVKLE